MSTKTIALISMMVLMQFKNSALAQHAHQFGGLPSLNLNAKLKKDWSLNAKIEARHLFLSRSSNGIVNTNYKYVLTDFSILAAKKVGLNSRLAAGYLIRLEDGELFHRLIQQYTIVQKLSGFRLAHRFLADQTFSSSEDPDFRIRYRITLEIPLNGESIDTREFYIRINNEYINSLQSLKYDLQIRLIPLLGYSITDNFKMELGMDYRVDSFFDNKTRHSYWVALNFFIDI